VEIGKVHEKKRKCLKRKGTPLLIGANVDRTLLARISFKEVWFWYRFLEPTRSWKVLKQSR
jgi:hypothetical protein